MSELIIYEQPVPEMPHSHTIRISNMSVPTEFNMAAPNPPEAFRTFWSMYDSPVVMRLHSWQYWQARRWIADNCISPMYYRIVRNMSNGEALCGDGDFRCLEFKSAMLKLRTHKFVTIESAQVVDQWLRINAPEYSLHAEGTKTVFYIEDTDAATAAALRFEHQPVTISG